MLEDRRRTARWGERLTLPLTAALSLSVLGLVVATAVIALGRSFGGFFWVRGTGSVTYVLPGTPAFAAGLGRGDVILTIGGEPTWLSVRRSIAASSAPAIGETLVLSVLRGGEVRTIGVRMVPPPLLERLHTLEILSIALCLALLGFLVWAHKPNDPVVMLFLLFTHSIAALIAVGWLTDICRPWAFLGFDLCLCLSSAAGVHFHLRFPRRLGFAGTRWLVLGLYGLAFCVPLVYLPGLRKDVDVDWYFLASGAARGYAVLATIAGAGLLLHAYRQAASEEDRRRIRLVVLGTVLGVAPTAGLSLLPEILDRNRGFFVPYELTLPFLLLIPAAYVAALQRYDVFRLERLVHRGVVHLVLLSMLATLYLALGVGVPRLLPWTDRPITRGLVALFIAVLFAPLRDRLQALADRLFYGGWYDYGAVLGEMTQALSGVVDADTLAGILGSRLARTLRLEGASLLLPTPEEGLAVVESDGWPGDRAPSPPLPKTGALAMELLRASRPVTSRELRGAVVGAALTEVEQSWLSRPRIKLWIPLVRQGALHGLLLLGAKAGDEAFDSGDLRMLGTLAWSAAVAAENVRLVTALRRRADEVNRLYSRLLQSREAERKRLARELHDRVIQELVNLHLSLDTPGSPPTREPTPAIREGLRSVIDNLRAVCTELRPSALDDLSLGLAIQGYVEEVSLKHGLEISLRLPHGGSEQLEALPEDVRLGLFRVLQEALTNVHRHAGASRVEVELAAAADRVTLEVRDDGRGFTCPADLGTLIRSGHFGLAGAHERMSLLGGSLDLESVPSGGTRLRASVPRVAP